MARKRTINKIESKEQQRNKYMYNKSKRIDKK
jgi:hypothetical protein